MQLVFLRKRGKKYIVTLEYRDVDSGKKKQKALSSFDKKKDAEKALVEEKSKINNNNFIVPKKLTFGEYLNNWISHHKDNISVTTYTRYKDILDRHVIPNLGEIELQKLHPLQLQNFYSSMLENLSTKTVLQYHRVIHKALDRAYKLQLISKNIADLVELPKPKKYKASVLDVKQVKQLLEACKNTRLEVPINIAIALGLRAGEILGLRWSDIDFQKNTLTINQAAVRGTDGKGVEFKEPKTESSNRTLTVPTELISILKEHRISQIELQLKSYGQYDNEHKLVFTKIDGAPMNSASFSRMFREFLKRKNLPLIRFHDLRHTNATLMLASGTSSKVASTRLGHSTIGITLDLYTHVLQELEQEAADNISNLIYKSPSK